MAVALMDPNACLQAIGYYAGSQRAAHCRFLLDWLSRGGFEPNWTAHREGTRAYRAWLRKYNKFSDLHR